MAWLRAIFSLTSPNRQRRERHQRMELVRQRLEQGQRFARVRAARVRAANRPLWLAVAGPAAPQGCMPTSVAGACGWVCGGAGGGRGAE
jgi:hypothetical protein